MVEKKLTSTEELANSILDALISEGLVLENQRADIFSSMTNGTMSQADWKLHVGIPVLKEGEKVAANQKD